MEAPPSPRQRSSVPDLSGTRVGRFAIQRCLGSGGMGEVYAAEDSALKRTVALKRLPPALQADAAYRRRLLKEAESASALNSPHVASVYDVLEDGEELFVVMEYVEGATLRQKCTRLPLDEFLEIAVQCVRALVAAHGKGLVHRDLKPENIMVTPEGQVKVLDFGLARHAPDTAGPEVSTESETGSAAGTRGYVAPEVLMGRAAETRSDIFALGVVFYELLTAHNPFAGRTLAQTIDRTLHVEAPPPSQANHDVPPELDRILRKMLARDARERYATAADLLVDLLALQRGETAPRPGFLRRHRVAILIMVLAVTAAILVVNRLLVPRPAFAARGWVLIADFDNQTGDPVFDKTVEESLTIALQQSRHINVLPRARIYEALQRMRRAGAARIDEDVGLEISRRENVQVLIAGSILRSGDTYRIVARAQDTASGALLFGASETFRGKDALYASMDRLAQRVRKNLGEAANAISQSRPLAKVTTASPEALQQYSLAADLMARGSFERVPELLESAIRLDSGFAAAHWMLAQYYSQIVSSNELSLEHLQRAYDLRFTVSDREQRRIEGSYYAAVERYEDAAASLRVLVLTYPDDAEAHLALSSACSNLAQFQEAANELREAIRLNPNSEDAYGSLVLMLARNNEPREALAVRDKARQRGMTSHHTFLWGAGLAYLELQDVAQAENAFKELRQRGGTVGSLGELYLTRILIYQGHLRQAVRNLQTGIAADRGTPRSGLNFVRWQDLGYLALLQGDGAAAAATAEEILRAPKAEVQINDLRVAGTLCARAGRLACAEQALRRMSPGRGANSSTFSVASRELLQAEIAAARANRPAAIGHFQAAWNHYPLIAAPEGLARLYAARAEWAEAAHQWELVLGEEGEILKGWPVSMWVTAHLELARCYRHLGDARAAALYRTFLELWKSGDDASLQRAAQAELASIGPPARRP